MKTNSRPGYPGFTLIELMAVITIIVILAGLVVGGLGFVNDRQAKEKAKVQIALLSKALEEYKLDNGVYPPSGNSADGVAQSVALYVPLFYEGYDYNRQVNPPADWTKTVSGTKITKSIKIYLPDLDPVSSKQGWITAGTTVPTSLPVTDPWGQPYRYRSALGGSGTANALTINPDFDLWSSGKDTLTMPASAADARNRDDIKNF